MQIGNIVLLKQASKLVKAIVIDIDLTYVTLKFEYKKGQHCTVKVKNGSKDIIRIGGIDVNKLTRRNIV